MLIHSRSAATARISDTCNIGWILSARARTASMASTAYRRGNRYSDCNSSPLLGVKPMRKCGRRSHQRPGLPNCGVQEATSSSRIGCRSTAAATAPKREDPEDAAKNLTQLATVGREDGYTHFIREEGVPTTGNEGEIYRLSFRVGELERRRDQGDFTEEEKNELAKLSLRRRLLLGQVLLG